MRIGFEFSIPKYDKFSFQSNTHTKKTKQYPTYLELRKEIGLQINAFHFVVSLVNPAKRKMF